MVALSKEDRWLIIIFSKSQVSVKETSSATSYYYSYFIMNFFRIFFLNLIVPYSLIHYMFTGISSLLVKSVTK